MWPSDQQGEESPTQRRKEEEEDEDERKPQARKPAPPSDSALPVPSTPQTPKTPRTHRPLAHKAASTPKEGGAEERPRQVIAVSASKGPAAFFNLARKFLVTDEICDLSALEGAIVAAVDAAHLLERSKLATIIKVNTSYVTVEPKRKKQPPPAQATPKAPPTPASEEKGRTRELRRARIVITVQRTEHYKQWLQENPLQAVIAGDDGDEVAGVGDATPS